MKKKPRSKKWEKTRRDRLEECYQALFGQHLDMGSPADDADSDARAMLVTWESYLAGVAKRLIDGAPLETEHYLLLAQPVLLGTAVQFAESSLNPDGPYDAAHMPEVLAYAQTIEELRCACAEFIPHLRTVR